MVQVTLGILVPDLGSVTQPAKGSVEGLDSVTAVFVSPVKSTVGRNPSHMTWFSA